MMNRQTDVPEEMYDDEVVCFFADRYHVTPRKVMQRFVEQDGSVSEAETTPGTFRLEENEMAILRDMIAVYHS